MTGSILITDYAWPDLTIERDLFAAAGFDIISVTDQTDGRTALDLIPDCVAIMTCWATVSGELLKSGTNLRSVARFGVGTDNIDLVTARSLGLPVTYVPDYCVEEVSDHALALCLAWMRGVVRLDAAIRSGSWDPAAVKLRRVRSLTIGVWGYGRIGRRVAEKFAGIGCTVIAYDPIAPTGGPVERVDLEELLRRSDVVTLHMPPAGDGSSSVGADEFAAMKTDALLMNTARGALVDTQALLNALDSGHIGGAALDVVSGEPDLPAELVAHQRVILTPHVAFSSTESIVELRERACLDVIRVLKGETPLNPVPA